MIPPTIPLEKHPSHGHRFLPNGDILPQNRFRSLNRPNPKLGIQAHNFHGRQHPLPSTKKFSRSEWDLRTEHHGLPPPPNANLAYTSSSGQSPATSVVESGHSDDPHSDRSEQHHHQGGSGSGGFFRSQRHHGHYFSNAELFAQPSLGFNYLKYAKACDFEQTNTK